MSAYNMLFGMNAYSDVLLAMLGLTRGSTGRFRDVRVELSDGRGRAEKGEPLIVVHTRNGGGNRECWHESDPKWGDRECRHHVEQEEAPVYAFMPQSEWPDGKAPGNIFTSRNGVYGCEYRTGETYMADRFVCEAPGSAECACPGCIIEFRLPKHAMYLWDEDDDFDRTYADIYFRVPDRFRAGVLAIATENPQEKPADRWQTLFAQLRAPDAANDPDVQRVTEAMRPIIEQIAAEPEQESHHE